MKKILLITALLSALLLTATSCGEETPPAETVASTTAATVADTEPETTPETTAPETTAPETQSETTPETTIETIAETESDTTPADEATETEEKQLPPGLFSVGYSYSGNLTCYNGSYDFGYDVCRAGDGTYFTSVQDCVDYLETLGGGTMSIDFPLDICLYLDIPDDGNSYIIYYNFVNCDFIFDHGVIYDDSKLDTVVAGIPGFAYYSDLSVLDAIGGLENTSIWFCGDEDENFEKGRYSMTAKQDGDTMHYHYEKIAEMDEWYGLIEGEYLPEE